VICLTIIAYLLASFWLQNNQYTGEASQNYKIKNRLLNKLAYKTNSYTLKYTHTFPRLDIQRPFLVKSAS